MFARGNDDDGIAVNTSLLQLFKKKNQAYTFT